MVFVVAVAVFYPSQLFVFLITSHSSLPSCFSLSAISFINQLYSIKRNPSIFIPLMLFSLIECWPSCTFEEQRGLEAAITAAIQDGYIHLNTFPPSNYLNMVFSGNITLWKIVQIPTVGKVIKTSTVGLALGKPHYLSSLCVFF